MHTHTLISHLYFKVWITFFYVLHIKAQSHPQLQSEKLDPVKGKGIRVNIEDDETDLSILEVDSDSEMEEFEDAESFQGKMTTGSHLPILKIDSHTRPCSSERLPSTDDVEDVVVLDEEEEEEEEVVVVDDNDDDDDDNIRFRRIAESFTSGFPYFQRRLERACVEEIFILVRTLALFLFSFTLVLTLRPGSMVKVVCIHWGPKFKSQVC